MTAKVLVLGARGRFGRHAAQAFSAAGWQVRAFTRGDASYAGPCEIATGDAADPAAVVRAAEGVDVIVQAVNPPYPDWSRALPPLTTALLAAAETSGATVLLPGNVYGYGSAPPERMIEGEVPRPDTRKGRLRVELENRLREAAEQGRIRAIVLRAGDFIDDRVSGNWFDAHMSKGVAKGRFMYPGPLDRMHAWAWLPDLARAAERLAARRNDLPPFASFGFEGWSVDGAQLVRAVERAAGRPMKVSGFPWLALRLAAPAWPLGRELLEMRYLWDRPHRIDGSALRETLAGLEETPIDAAMPLALAPHLRG